MSASASRIAAGVLEPLGAPGVIAIALLAFCAAFHWGTNIPAQEELSRLAALRAKLEQMRSSAARPERAQNPEKELERFYAKLPARAQVERAAERIYGVGLRHGVTLRQGTYRYTPEKGTRLARYEATYVAQTEYHRTRLMVRDLLKEMPSLSLDEISMQRQQPSATSAELALKVSLYVRGD
ncbi:MAG: hypothetical protein IT514_13915 [Burkholderiales bacterium]|nr:hypothetical protein [Burkholderiales bacterium]